MSLNNPVPEREIKVLKRSLTDVVSLRAATKLIPARAICQSLSLSSGLSDAAVSLDMDKVELIANTQVRTLFHTHTDSLLKKART
jgi:hypothetical protein